MIKMFNKGSIEGRYFNKKKAKYHKPTAHIIVNSVKLKAFPARSVIKMPTLNTFIQQSTESLWVMRQKKKRNPNCKGRNKIITACRCLQMTCRWHRKPHNPTERLLELINEFGKVTGYRTNLQKSIAFLRSNNELSKRIIKKKIPFTVVSKITKYLGINLRKNVF